MLQKHVWKETGLDDNPCFTPFVPSLPAFLENEWDMTWGHVYLQLVKLQFFDVKDILPYFVSK